MSKQHVLRDIPITNIVVLDEEKTVRGVKPDTKEFQEFLADVKQRGVLQPIVVVPNRDEDGEVIEGSYILWDGLQRLTAAGMCKMSYIPAHVLVDAEAKDMLVVQTVSNLQRIEFKPAQQAQAFMKLLDDPDNDYHNTEDIARAINKSRSFVDNRLKLLKLPEEIREKIDTGEIVTQNGYYLATKLLLNPKVEDDVWQEAVRRAESDTTDEFSAWVTQKRAEIVKARRSGVTSSGADFRHPKLLKQDEVYKQYSRLKAEKTRLEEAALKKAGLTEPTAQREGESDAEFIERVDAYEEAAAPVLAEAVSEKLRTAFEMLGWCLQIDDKTWARRQAEKEAKEKAKEEAKEAKRAEKESLAAAGA